MKIAVFHGGDIFVDPLIKDWQSKGHEVRKNPNYSIWPDFKPDMIWFEFCTSNIVAYTNNFVHAHGKAPLVVCRLHGVGQRLNIYKNVKWEYVDHLIFVSKRLKSICETGTDLSKTKLHTIYNGIDLAEFTLKESFEPTYNLAFVGRATKEKGLDLLPDIVARFRMISPLYTLQKATGQIKHSMMNQWLEDKDYLIHPSRVESFCVAVAEAMAKGIKPLINRWEGAEEFWDEEFYFENWKTKQDPLRMRKIIEDRYDIRRTIEQVSSVCEIS